MGNCAGSETRRVRRAQRKEESMNPALRIIREAQKRNLKLTEKAVDAGKDDVLDNDDMEDSCANSASFDSSTASISSVDSLYDNDEGDETKLSEISATSLLKNRDKNVGYNMKGERVNVKRKKKNLKDIGVTKREEFNSDLSPEDQKAREVNIKEYDYPFENIVFEGGGEKGLAYCGSVRLLEELGVWARVRRVTGASAGAMTAALGVVGYTSHDLEAFLRDNINNILIDHKCCYLSLLPNMVSSYGWNPGEKAYKWFGRKMKEKTKNPDVTFKQVYEMFGKELCIVVTNLNQMTSLYCHPKTTPHMPVRLAVRMSMSIPAMFSAVKHSVSGTYTDVFVDGGVLCNYPIHCFDGWWLSMKPEHSFLEKLQPLEDIPRLLDRSERFGEYNAKTLGLKLYEDKEQELQKNQLEAVNKITSPLTTLPDTKLAREKQKKKRLQIKTTHEHRRLVSAMNAFLYSLRIHNTDKNDAIDRGELEAALDDTEHFPPAQRAVLFGDVTSCVIADCLDTDQNGQIKYDELVKFMEQIGISFQDRFLDYDRCEIKNLIGYLQTLFSSLLTNVQRVYVKESDLKRTVGINTGHVGTTDFVLEPPDVAFMIERGRRSLEAFLKYYVVRNNLPKRAECRSAEDNVDNDVPEAMEVTQLTQRQFTEDIVPEMAAQEKEDEKAHLDFNLKEEKNPDKIIFKEESETAAKVEVQEEYLEAKKYIPLEEEKPLTMKKIVQEKRKRRRQTSYRKEEKADEILLLLRRT